MKSRLLFFTLIAVLVIACKSFEPFTTAEEKKAQLNLIKDKFQLTNKEFKKIKNEDSILFTIGKSLKKNIKLSLIERRLDSFFLDSYDRRDLQAILLMDYHLPNFKHELNRKKDASGIEFKNIEEMKAFFSPDGKFETDMNRMLGMKKKKDSTDKKKEHK
ncbi:MAG: hypothetical protein AAF611_03490 [Bacteroidota bacterium]